MSVLPPELLVEVFRWATWPPPHIKYSVSYSPFSDANATISRNDPSVNLKLKYDLALVSRQCRNLVTEFLYEHITFRRSPATDEIVPSQAWLEQLDYGRYVKSVQICRSLFADQHPSDCFKVWASILQTCPNVEVVLRSWWSKSELYSVYGRSVFPSSNWFEQFSESTRIAAPPCFSNITHVEWEYSSHYNIQLFHDIVSRLPNLRWLSLTSIVGAGNGGRALTHPYGHSLILPAVTTLCLRIENAMMYRDICRWILPQLTHLIIEEQDVHIGGANDRVMHRLFLKFGQTLETLELGRGKYKHFRQSDVVSLAVTQCPKLRMLSYYARYTMVPSVSHNLIVAKSLRHVCLHAESKFQPDMDLFPMHMLRLIAWLRRFEELVYITLYGDWSAVLKDLDVIKVLSNCHWVIKTEDGTIWPYA